MHSLFLERTGTLIVPAAALLLSLVIVGCGEDAGLNKTQVSVDAKKMPEKSPVSVDDQLAAALQGIYRPNEANGHFGLLKKLSEQNNAKAKVLLAVAYTYGYKIPRDYAEAVKLFNETIATEPDAAAYLAGLYFLGHGVPQDSKKGAELLELSLKQGSNRAKMMQGMSDVQNSNGNTEKFGNGIKLIQASQKTEKIAYLLESIAYEDYSSPIPKLSEAFRALEKGVDDGCILCFGQIGRLYESGSGTLKSYERAAVMYQKGADLGDGLAQFLLAQLYIKGLGVAPDAVRAYAWLNLVSVSDTPTLPESTRNTAIQMRDELQFLKK